MLELQSQSGKGSFRICSAERNAASGDALRQAWQPGQCGNSACCCARCQRNGNPARQHPPNENRLVGFYLLQQPVEPAPVGPLLGDKRNREPAAQLCRVDPPQQFHQRRAAEAVAYRRSRHSAEAHRVELAIERDRVEQIHPGLMHLSGGACTDIDVDLIGMRATRDVLPTRLEVRGKPSHHAGNPFALARVYHDGLGSVQ